LGAPAPEPPAAVAVAPKPAPAAAPAPPDEPGPAAGHRARRGRSTLGGKRVVLEFDQRTPPSAAPAPRPTKAPAPGVDPNVVERARAAYLRGNQRLFAGNAADAIVAYKESLAIYPGYVAGYRGLGLAYAERGNPEGALAAFRLYLRTVPNAHDAAIIQARIDRLQHR
jgi:tetratricopeptide (TPR) repeat protein